MVFYDSEYVSNLRAKGIYCRCFHDGAASIYSDLNISSSTDAGTGDYYFNTEVTFTTVSYAHNCDPKMGIASSARIAAHHSDRDTTTRVAEICIVYSHTATDVACSFHVAALIT